MSRTKPFKDPRGHSLRVYSDLYDSSAFRALSPHDILAYLALLRELKAYNNGDLSLTLTRAKSCGIKHHVTLARSLRALCAVGLVAITRKGGCAKGGRKLPTLYRVTDRECFDIPAKHLEALKETNEWKRITSVEQSLRLIHAAEQAVVKEPEEKNNAGHAVTTTSSPRDMFKPKTRTLPDTLTIRQGHGVTMVEKASNPIGMRVAVGFLHGDEYASPRTARVLPLYIATPTVDLTCPPDQGTYRRLTARPFKLFTNLTNQTNAPAH